MAGSGDTSAILTDQYSNVEIGYCRINTIGSLFLIQLTGSGTGDPNYTNIGSVHHCDIQGNTNDGYSAISLTRFGQAEIYNNYIHNVRANSGVGSTLIRVRNGHDNKIYNNLLVIDNGTTARNFFQTRAGGTATLVHRNQFYNNTAVIEGTLAEAVCFMSEDSSYNKCFNNLVIGNVNKFVDGWGISGSNNELYNNVITGSLNMWFASGWETAFSVTSGGTSNQGITFINLSGNKPSPYWDLSASKDGATAAGLITDYNEDTRNFPQDVGAFEYTLTDTTPPALSNGLPNSQLSAGATQATLSLTTDENATCRYSTSVGISYSSITNTFSTTGSTNHSTTVSGLSDGYNYNYYIRCQDTANNANVSDYSISFSVASPASDTTPPSAPTGLVVE